MFKTLIHPLFELLPRELRELLEWLRATLSFIVGDIAQSSGSLLETLLVMGPKLLRLAQPMLQQALLDPEATVALFARLQPLLTRLLETIERVEFDEKRLEQALHLISEHIVDVLLQERSDSVVDDAVERFAGLELAIRRGAESVLDLYLGD